MPIENGSVEQSKGLITPNFKFFEFCRDQVPYSFLQFALEQIGTKADFLQNGLYIFKHGRPDLTLLTDFKQGNEGNSEDVTLFLKLFSIE